MSMSLPSPARDATGRKRIIVFTRYPEAGRVKSRLIPVLGPQGSADLLKAMIRRTVGTAGKVAEEEGLALEIHVDGGDPMVMRELCGDELTCMPQQGRDLGERMHSAIRGALRAGAGAAVLIGTDCPGITGAVLRKAFLALDKADCVIGPAADGGYWLIGMTRDIPEVFESMPWGTHEVLDRTLGVLQRLRVRMSLLEQLCDVDRPEDLPVWEEARDAARLPLISVIVPVLNEGEGVCGTIQRALAGRNAEVIVVDGGSGDDTALRAAETGARVIPARRGRAVQMNRGAQASAGDILLFLHADTLLPEGYDGMVRQALAGSHAAAGAFSLAFDDTGALMRATAFGANLRSRLLGLPYGDQAIFTERRAFVDAGGFPEIPIMEDVAFIRSARKLGDVRILPGRVTTSGRRHRALGPVRTWVLNQVVLSAFSLGVPPEMLAVLYRDREKSTLEWIRRMAGAWKGGNG